MKCKLCIEKDANQSGSHIFTHALISGCTNSPGEKGRDKEIMFGIPQKGGTSLFVGRSVGTEKIKELKNRELSDEEIAANKNRLTVDNYFCTDCEKLFGKIESRFSANHLKQIRTGEILQIERNEIPLLFFLIQAWRASVCKYNGYRLAPEFEEYLRRIIWDGCTQAETEFLPQLQKALNSIPIHVTYLETSEGKEGSNFVVPTENVNPYIVFLCDFVIQIFYPVKDIARIVLPNFFNLNENPFYEYINFNGGPFKISKLSEVNREVLLKEFMNEKLVTPFINNCVRQYIEICKQKGTNITDGKIKAFVEKLTKEENVAFAERYTETRIYNLCHNMAED